MNFKTGEACIIAKEVYFKYLLLIWSVRFTVIFLIFLARSCVTEV
jgi:hypothetical protein